MQFENPSRALVLLSGGLDSTTAVAWAIERFGHLNVSAVAFDYGQRHIREIRSARDVAETYRIDLIELSIPKEIFSGAGSSLMGEADVPQKTYDEMGDAHMGPSSTYVPFRNGTLLSIAAAHAQSHGFDAVVGGWHANDALNWAYPDCTVEFLGPMAAAIFVGTYGKVRLLLPFAHMLKHEIVRLGLEMDAPYELTWSCYVGDAVACGTCPTCLERLQAFRDADSADPIYYKNYDILQPPLFP